MKRKILGTFFQLLLSVFDGLFRCSENRAGPNGFAARTATVASVLIATASAAAAELLSHVTPHGVTDVTVNTATKAVQSSRGRSRGVKQPPGLLFAYTPVINQFN